MSDLHRCRRHPVGLLDLTGGRFRQGHETATERLQPLIDVAQRLAYPSVPRGDGLALGGGDVGLQLGAEVGECGLQFCAGGVGGVLDLMVEACTGLGREPVQGRGALLRGGGVGANQCFQPAQVLRRASQFVHGGLKAVGLRRAQGLQLLLQGHVFRHIHFIQLRFEFGNFFLQFER